MNFIERDNSNEIQQYQGIYLTLTYKISLVQTSINIDKQNREISRQIRYLILSLDRTLSCNFKLLLPKSPVITNKEPKLIQLFNWGLLPNKANSQTFNKRGTLNVRIETLREKNHSGISLTTDVLFYWTDFRKWLDKTGKSKQQYQLSLPNDEAFGLAGLWDVNFINDKPYFSYTIITTKATGLMAEIHNSKERMPMIISKGFEDEWLNNKELKIDNDLIIATKIGKPTKPVQHSLFN